MLQPVDGEPSERQRWMSVLSRAPLETLEAWRASLGEVAIAWLRRPESGLVMLRARAGGDGAQFNLGEMTVTRCTLRSPRGRIGVSYVQGRSERRAELAALADAYLQDADTRAEVERDLIEPLRARMKAETARRARKVQATRVDFFTLVRGES